MICFRKVSFGSYVLRTAGRTKSPAVAISSALPAIFCVITGAVRWRPLGRDFRHQTLKVSQDNAGALAVHLLVAAERVGQGAIRRAIWSVIVHRP